MLTSFTLTGQQEGGQGRGGGGGGAGEASSSYQLIFSTRLAYLTDTVLKNVSNYL